MRTIKFRVWDRDDNDMKYISSFLSWKDMNSDNRVVMQYTGLKDKNGVEIYEGDIIEYERCSDSDCEIETSIVRFENGGFSPMCEEYGGSSGFLYDKRITDIKRLGNIYENPELLEGK